GRGARRHEHPDPWRSRDRQRARARVRPGVPRRDVQRRATPPSPARQGAGHRIEGRMSARLGIQVPEAARAGLDALIERANAERWAERLFDRDTTLWTTDPDVSADISDRLGWLDAPEHFGLQVAALEGFGDGLADAGF